MMKPLSEMTLGELTQLDIINSNELQNSSSWIPGAMAHERDCLARRCEIRAEIERRKATHQHARDCYDDPGPGDGSPQLICGKIEGVDRA